ncbi:MAG: HAMP domain-containing histidine kinase, partial [Phycisphaerae bacterium]
MTLRLRLLLVYLIVVLLSVATVGVAVYELNRTQSIYGPLLVWHDVVWDSHRLRAAFPAIRQADDGEREFENLLTGVQQKIASVGGYIDVDYMRDWYIIRLRQAYQAWKDAPPQERAAAAQTVAERLDDLTDAVELLRVRLNDAAEQQRTNKWVLVGAAMALAILHVAVIGWLLRLWLLRPMERLNRQVAALAQDRPPPEPLLTAPRELASLATALDQARQSLAAYRQQLIDGERLTTIGQFAAQLAHNLRNPLASIRAAAQVAARHDRGPDYVRERMDEIIASVDRLNRWIGGLMEIARREPTPMRHADVVPLLHQIREALRPELTPKEITLAVEAPEEGLICAHDPATLEQALVAMVVNAIEA